jgi:DUF971 family protein
MGHDMSAMPHPTRIEAIGTEIALLWSDGAESYLPMERLRAWSPSAENTGERDLLGKQYGGTDQKHFPGVTVSGWRMIGGYAVQFDFSDGHNTGIYSWEYLRKLTEYV